MKSGIENISETLQTLKVSPTKEDGQFPQTPAIKESLKWLSKACIADRSVVIFLTSVSWVQ